ncbi:sortase [Actinoplanes sp. KI2]|uniref:sortase domain-containing protein n=1 Tax=Actinoplanes sp. KI2 TaxID=2983315 RepID=UPI0021D60471|nr:sortase [Actinoplanes sp. KI2]MCU7729195.1 sortase [Actinoplanes sp. KI2]
MLADARKEKALGPSVPVGLEIPAIGVRTDVVPIGSRPERALDVPAASADAPVGWDRRTPAPGEAGSSVIVGQADAVADGPAAFARLRLLRPGDEILVDRADGVRVRFVVTGVGLYPRKAFPNERVYGHRDHPELTLVTRGGTIDNTNLVVYARSVPD